MTTYGVSSNGGKTYRVPHRSNVRMDDSGVYADGVRISPTGLSQTNSCCAIGRGAVAAWGYSVEVPRSSDPLAGSGIVNMGTWTMSGNASVNGMSMRGGSSEPDVVWVSHKIVNGPSRTVVGDHNSVNGANVEVYGNHNTVVGPNARVYGNFNTVDGVNATVRGDDCTVSGINVRCTGLRCHVVGTNSRLMSKSADLESYPPPAEPPKRMKRQESDRVRPQSSETAASRSPPPKKSAKATTDKPTEKSVRPVEETKVAEKTPPPESKAPQVRDATDIAANTEMAADEPVESDDKTACKICMERKSQLAPVECKHLCLCFHCAAEMISGSRARDGLKCPMCNGPIERKMEHIFA